MTDSIVRSRIDPDVKLKASQICQQLGLTLSEAIRLFLYQTVAEKQIPFVIKVPNNKTRQALAMAESGTELAETSLKQLAQAWDSACGK